MILEARSFYRCISVSVLESTQSVPVVAAIAFGFRNSFNSSLRKELPEKINI
jgi:hypothetical protein